MPTQASSQFRLAIGLPFGHASLATLARSLQTARLLMRFDGFIARLLWRVLALVLVALGLIGVVLPGLPTVPFLLAAAWAGGRGWPALERWLLEHPRYGENIRQWRQGGAVPRRAKWVASLMMIFSSAVLLVTTVPIVVKVGAPLLMVLMAIWLWKRPEP